MKQHQTLDELIANRVQYFEQQSYSPLRIERNEALWKIKLIPFMIQKSILNYDRSVGEEYYPFLYSRGIVSPL